MGKQDGGPVDGHSIVDERPLLAKIRWLLRNAHAIIVPERTSAALRWFGWSRLLIHFRHGAGDRAPSSEARLRAFDFIFVAGQKDIDRAIAQGVDRKRLSAVGYIKMDYLGTIPAGLRLFGNDRPIVLYNPHFDRSISSISLARDVIARFREQERYNLVFAPISTLSRIWMRPLAQNGRSFRSQSTSLWIWIHPSSST
ncbi:hypothetical protein ACFSHP_19980 [Novosphingobium panipatense]